MMGEITGASSIITKMKLGYDLSAGINSFKMVAVSNQFNQILRGILIYIRIDVFGEAYYFYQNTGKFYNKNWNDSLLQIGCPNTQARQLLNQK